MRRRAQSSVDIIAYPHNKDNNHMHNNINNNTSPWDPHRDKHSMENIQIRLVSSSGDIPRIIPRVGSRSSLKQPGSLRNSLSKNVSFHQIEIREFAIELGDNPCATGAPITIGWEPQSNDILPFDEYEATKQGCPRERGEFHMPARFRFELLQNQGTTMRQIMDVEKVSRKIKKARVDSVKNMRWDGVNEKLEAARRTVKKVATKHLHMSKRSSTVQAVAPCTQGEDHDDDEGPLMF
jgi:hypothetical protein